MTVLVAMLAACGDRPAETQPTRVASQATTVPATPVPVTPTTESTAVLPCNEYHWARAEYDDQGRELDQLNLRTTDAGELHKLLRTTVAKYGSTGYWATIVTLPVEEAFHSCVYFVVSLQPAKLDRLPDIYRQYEDTQGYAAWINPWATLSAARAQVESYVSTGASEVD